MGGWDESIDECDWMDRSIDGRTDGSKRMDAACICEQSKASESHSNGNSEEGVEASTMCKKPGNTTWGLSLSILPRQERGGERRSGRGMCLG
jgi:hypothetical protein